MAKNKQDIKADSEELVKLINLYFYGYITAEDYDREYEKLILSGKAET